MVIFHRFDSLRFEWCWSWGNPRWSRDRTTHEESDPHHGRSIYGPRLRILLDTARQRRSYIALHVVVNTSLSLSIYLSIYLFVCLSIDLSSSLIGNHPPNWSISSCWNIWNHLDLSWCWAGGIEAQTYAAWWFGTFLMFLFSWEFHHPKLFFHSVGTFIIPINELIFFRGVGFNH